MFHKKGWIDGHVECKARFRNFANAPKTPHFPNKLNLKVLCILKINYNYFCMLYLPNDFFCERNTIFSLCEGRKIIYFSSKDFCLHIYSRLISVFKMLLDVNVSRRPRGSHKMALVQNGRFLACLVLPGNSVKATRLYHECGYCAQ